MKVLMTGGCGFLGAWIARRLLESGAGVRLFDRADDLTMVRAIVGDPANGIECVKGDVTDTAQVADALAGCDRVIHLAGWLTPACQADPIGGARVNVIGTLNVFEAARRHGVDHVVYTSSVGVFGPEDGRTPEPNTHYGAFKLANEGCARAYWTHDGISSVGLRVGVVYGPGREVGLSAGATLACRAAARGEDYVIGFSGATCLVYVEDVAATYAEVLTHPAAGAHVFNVPGEPTAVDAIIAEIRRHAPEIRLSATGAPQPFTADVPADALHARYPGIPKTSLREGVARTIAHYRA